MQQNLFFRPKPRSQSGLPRAPAWTPSGTDSLIPPRPPLATPDLPKHAPGRPGGAAGWGGHRTGASGCPSQAQLCTPRKQRLLGPETSRHGEVLGVPRRPGSGISSPSSRNHRAQGLANNRTAKHWAPVGGAGCGTGSWGRGRGGRGGQLLLSAKPVRVRLSSALAPQAAPTPRRTPQGAAPGPARWSITGSLHSLAGSSARAPSGRGFAPRASFRVAHLVFGENGVNATAASARC